MFHARNLSAVLLMLSLCLVATAALADDWVAVKLRGGVFAYVEGDWVRLARGDVVSDQRVVRTQLSGHVTFQRDAETITVGPNSQIQIVDRIGRRYTTVQQHFGAVEIEAEVQNVQHFAVQTPYLAAIVKGTNFVVTTSKSGSNVRVKRGRVQVNSLTASENVVIGPGQSAQTGRNGAISVGGRTGEAAPAASGKATLRPGNGSGAGGGAFNPPGVNPDVGGPPAGSGAPDGVQVTVGGGDSPVGVSVGASPGGIEAGANVGGISAGVSVGGTPDGGLGADVALGGSSGNPGIGVSVTTGGGGEPGGVSVETPLGGVSIGLPLGL